MNERHQREASSRQPGASLRSLIGAVLERLLTERRWLRLMRVVVGTAFLSWFLFFALLLPWNPLGTVVPGQNSAGTLRFLTLVAGVFSSVLYWTVWRPTLRHESSLEFVRVLLGAGLLIRCPSQFKNRLALECDRGVNQDRRAFSLIVIQLAGPDEREPGRSQRREFEEDIPAIAVRAIARRGDVVAGTAWNEVWVLATAADESARDIMIRRMASRLTDSTEPLDRFVDARIGASTFGADGTMPPDLFDSARAALVPMTSVLVEEAAA